MPKFDVRFLLFISLQLSFYCVNNSYGFADFNMNPQTKFSQMRGQNFPSNKKFDAVGTPRRTAGLTTSANEGTP